MTYSVESFYDVIKEDLYKNPSFIFTMEELDTKLEMTLLSFLFNTEHFSEMELCGKKAILPITPFGTFIDGLEFALRDFSNKRGEELLDIALYIGFQILEEKIVTLM
jgi:hypothetical protein